MAEDSPAIRRVLTRQLLRMGIEADAVADGLQGLERWRSGGYGLVLTDLHMPGLDGCALSAAIRAEEAAARRTPIVLLTASELAEDELRCRSAGVDAYLIKPVRPPQLRSVVERLLGAGGFEAVAGAGSAPPALPVIDLTVLEELVGTDPDVIASILSAFRDGAAEAREAVHHAQRAGDMARLGDAAHKLKSSARTIGAGALGGCCANLEAAALDAEPARLNRALAQFDSELRRVFDQLAAR